MSASAAAAVRSWPVGPYTCTMTVPRPDGRGVVHAVAEWTPNEPARLSTEEWRQYRAGRNKALAEIAVELGLSIAVLEA